MRRLIAPAQNRREGHHERMVLRERADKLLSLREWLCDVDSGGGRMVFIAGELPAAVVVPALLGGYCRSCLRTYASPGPCGEEGT